LVRRHSSRGVVFSQEGILIPKYLLEAVQSVEIRREGDTVVVIPIEKRLPKSLEEIKAILSQHKCMIQKQYNVTELGIFGS
jgi:virulence-associated protein VagC